jgi:hypothetical protein
MNEATAARYRRFLALLFAGLFFAAFGLSTLATALFAGIRPAFST